MGNKQIYLSSLFGLVILAALVLIIAYIDVGQGDAILLRDPGWFDVLIDGGRLIICILASPLITSLC